MTKKTSNTTSKIKKTRRIPYHYKPEDMSYEQWQIGLRRQFALEQNFKMINIGKHEVYSDFELENIESKSIYKVAIRSEKIGLNFCNCPDFKGNTLGTCKHIEYVLNKLKSKKKIEKLFKNPTKTEYTSIFIKYGEIRKIMIRIGTNKKQEFEKLTKKYFDKDLVYKDQDFDDFYDFLNKATKLDPEFRSYPDVYEYVLNRRDSIRRKNILQSANLDGMLKVNLYNYQKEAVLKAASSGRSIIADEMGLGKTIQAICVAVLMSKKLGVEKVLIVCPTSLKYQWKTEIEKFCSRSSKVIEGNYLKRKEQYLNPDFFNIITYNVVKNDIENIEKLSPDLIILDEAQRIKNWKTVTAKSIKKLRSQYALVLTGTPLENKLEELHSIVGFIDAYKLGPLFRFLADHQILEGQKVVGYKDLHKIKDSLSDIMIRRTKDEVLKDLPKRTDKNLFVPMTQPQLDIHSDSYDNVCRIVNKWKRMKFLSEKDRQSLMINLNIMRMVCDSTFILDQKLDDRHDTKINELMEVLKDIFANTKSKVVIFSQWERMTRLVAMELDELGIGYQYLHGGVPSPKRKDLLTNFHNDDDSKVFLSTDAGGVGLNLQCANYIINLDCPWNPAVLEQRIGRVYRLGQEKPVEVINFISKGTIEESMLSTIKFKKSLFSGVLDDGKNEVFMGDSKFKQFMRTVENITDTQNEQEPTTTTSQVEEEEVKKDNVENENISSKKTKETNNSDRMQNLFATGISFLEKISGELKDTNKREKLVSKFVETDRQTGKQNIKIPVPDKEIVEKATDVLNMFLDSLKK